MNRKGLSDIVTNVLIILLVIVAIGILWAFLQPVFTKSGSKLQQSQDCMSVVVNPVKCTTATSTVMVSRSAGASGVNISEVKVISEMAAGTASAASCVAAAAITELSTVSCPVAAGAAKVGIAVGFKDAQGVTNYCPESTRIACA